jgi:integrase/recombinase XerD
MKREQKIPELLSVSEVKRIIDICQNPKYRMMIMLCYGCGLRLSEVCSLKVKNIAGEEKVIHLQQAKGAKDRRIPVSESLLHQLRLYWQGLHPIIYLFFLSLEKINRYINRHYKKLITKRKKMRGF